VLLILCNLYSKYLAKKALEGFGGFKLGGQVVHTVLVLMAKEETVLQRLSETGRWLWNGNEYDKN